ncbi:uncharacterized protein LOC143817905 [Ranitomeya variabilis]|uniref:uncharacterized protein LOC143817905 n=1 Tax=Ranitomeya variabilis TaxID=490064 RepID=UPI004057B2B3
MEPLRSVRPLMVLVLLYPGADSSDVVTVRRGDPAVLQCEVDPGDTLLSVTWKLRLYDSSCVISYNIEEDNNKTSYSSCSTRMRSDHLSLTINNTEISDEGTYACQVVNDFAKITQYFLLQVLGYKLRFDNIWIIIITVIFTALSAGILLYLKIKCQG